MNVLLTGGSGRLGSALTLALRASGHSVRVMSRRARTSASAGLEWVQADIASGAGVASAVHGVDAIMHAASDPANADAVDVEGTRRLIDMARAAGMSHLIYVSIVGVDAIPVPYYARKLKAEQLVQASGLGHSILRATQFHSFVNFRLTRLSSYPLVMPVPMRFRLQSVLESEVAERLVACLDDGPQGRLADFGGPEVLSLGEMARAWKDVKGVRKPLFNMPLPGAVAAAFAAGKATVGTAGEHGVTRWRDWLASQQSAQWG